MSLPLSVMIEMRRLQMAGLTEGVQPRFVTSRVLGNRSIVFPMKIMIWN